jgi:hypothetical protein
MTEISLYGGPHDGRVEILQDFYRVNGETCRRDGWPVIIEFRTYLGEEPAVHVAPLGEIVSHGRLVARYRLTEGITLEGRQVYEYVPD